MANNKIFLFVLILILQHVAEARVVDFSKDIKLQKHLQVHQCRQTCFSKTLSSSNGGDMGKMMDFSTCSGIPDCYMCYDYCELLPKAAIDLANSMCSDAVYCSKGCRIACSHHMILGSNTLIYETDQQ